MKIDLDKLNEDLEEGKPITIILVVILVLFTFVGSIVALVAGYWYMPVIVLGGIFTLLVQEYCK